MSLLSDLTTAIRDGSVEVVDLTAPLNDTTPVIRLPEPFGNTATFSLQEISRYDDRGPAWYWNDISTGEHTGTHFDAPVHWVTGTCAMSSPAAPVAQCTGASKWVPVCSPVLMSFQYQPGPRSSYLLISCRVKDLVFPNGSGSLITGVVASSLAVRSMTSIEADRIAEMSASSTGI